jgi:cystathionine beta-synthase
MNPRSHYETTGPEIWEQTEGRVTAFVAGAGTGGTLSGVGRYLKEQNPAVKIVGADIEGSVLSGDSPKPWKVEGIGEDFVPKTLNGQVIDEWIRISDAESFNMGRRLAREDGILVGGSSGTALAAAFKLAQRCTAEDVIVVACPDTGRNYISTMYDDGWMAAQGYLDRTPETTTLGDLLDALGDRKKATIILKPDDTLHAAAEILRRHGISQIPVIDGGRMIGAVEEITIMRALKQSADSKAVRIGDVMAKSLPQLDVGVLVEEAYRLLLAGNPAVVALKEKQIVGIITRSDLMEYYERVPQR